MVKALKAVKDLDEYHKQTGFVDGAISMWAFNFTHDKAKFDQFSGDINWFWDDNPTEKVTCPPTGPQPQIRRCVPHTYNGMVDHVTWKSFNFRYEDNEFQVDDLLEFQRVKYPGTAGNLHTDVLTGKGAILTSQEIIQDGKGFLEGYTEQLKYITTPTVQAQAEADVKMPYMLIDKGGGQGMMLFNTV